MMAGTTKGKARFFALLLVCFSLIVPAELHATLFEAGVHDVDAAISVHARHAEQDAHYEHSAIELQSHCIACVLTNRSEVLPILPEVQQHRMPPLGILLLPDTADHDLRLDLHAPSRAPPSL
jgi:hypothetical protein